MVRYGGPTYLSRHKMEELPREPASIDAFLALEPNDNSPPKLLGRL